jgi:uncharacterized RDD family membrane protein YckC
MENQYLDANLEQDRSSYFAYGGFWERFLAALIDGILLAIVGQVINSIMGISIMDVFRVTDPDDINEMFGAKYYIASAIGLGINWAYYAYLESSDKQATLGKQALNLVVTDLNGQKIDFQRASMRFLGKQILTVGVVAGTAFASPAITSLATLAGLVGYLMQPFTAKKQALHDIIAGTLVYKK